MKVVVVIMIMMMMMMATTIIIIIIIFCLFMALFPSGARMLAAAVFLRLKSLVCMHVKIPCIHLAIVI